MCLDKDFVENTETFLKNHIIVLEKGINPIIRSNVLKAKAELLKSQGKLGNPNDTTNMLPEKFYRMTLKESSAAIEYIQGSGPGPSMRVVVASVLGAWHDNEDAKGGFKAYWLPYRENKTKRLYLGTDCGVMFTAEMNGCSFGVGHRTPDGVLVTHANSVRTSNRIENELSRKKREERQKAEELEKSQKQQQNKSKGFLPSLFGSSSKSEKQEDRTGSPDEGRNKPNPRAELDDKKDKLKRGTDPQNKEQSQMIRTAMGKTAFQGLAIPHHDPDRFRVEHSVELTEEQLLKLGSVEDALKATVIGYRAKDSRGWCFQIQRYIAINEDRGKNTKYCITKIEDL